MEKNDCMRLESRMEARFSTFSVIAVTGYQSHAVRRVELIGYFVHFEHSFAYFTVKTKAYKVTVSHAVQL